MFIFEKFIDFFINSQQNHSLKIWGVKENTFTVSLLNLRTCSNWNKCCVSMHDLFKFPCLLITYTVILILLSFFRFKRLSKSQRNKKKINSSLNFFLNLICLLWIFDGVWILQLVSSETTAATRSSKATFKHCPKLKDAYTGLQKC